MIKASAAGPASKFHKKYSYELLNKNQLLTETITLQRERVRSTSKQLELNDPTVQKKLLVRFLRVRDSKTLVEFVKDFGIPIRHKGDHEYAELVEGKPSQQVYKVNSFLAASAAMRWLSTLRGELLDWRPDSCST